RRARPRRRLHHRPQRRPRPSGRSPRGSRHYAGGGSPPRGVPALRAGHSRGEARVAPNLMRRIRIQLAYDGTGFHGWQVQPGLATIQGELQAALGSVTGESPLPQGSGRTDAGVHALAQVASFQLAAPIPPENLLRALNRTLPPAIRVIGSQIVPATFHARHSAVAKSYEYRVFRGEVCPPWMSQYVCSYSKRLNFDVLGEAAKVFIGEHDFTSFAATDPDLAARE